MHKLSNPCSSPRKLTQSVVQITAMLGMYQAELARVLRLRCGDIGELANGRRDLQPQTDAWEQALLLVRFYQALYEKLGGDGAAMCNWLRRYDETLKGVPLLLMVDDDRLQQTLEYVERHM